ncbi:hypothetical protein MAPG_11398 [Magnaporthiopsis poae ATCC 64411]|uniref:Uncharacterized protein n=1 Tax=Magnaporthiopsis poae (strain ATCC 64411 / 73-15) TaxID=644358 RepID=A0A0C4EF64_MAGP6|nr:hypothetical protein MAPG_11398 [Magnaporthiopsis poae ATCC 64411]
MGAPGASSDEDLARMPEERQDGGVEHKVKGITTPPPHSELSFVLLNSLPCAVALPGYASNACVSTSGEFVDTGPASDIGVLPERPNHDASDGDPDGLRDTAPRSKMLESTGLASHTKNKTIPWLQQRVGGRGAVGCVSER